MKLWNYKKKIWNYFTQGEHQAQYFSSVTADDTYDIGGHYVLQTGY